MRLLDLFCCAGGAGAGYAAAGFEVVGVDIDWMTKHELSQSIPPRFTEYVGRQIIEAIS